jgi:hypothetical protein
MKLLSLILSTGLALLTLFIGFGVAIVHLSMAHLQFDMVIFMAALYCAAVAIQVVQPFWIPVVALVVPESCR